MSNMGYCRFRNTLNDLRDCYDAMDDDDLSPEESSARKAIIRVCEDILSDYGDEEN